MAYISMFHHRDGVSVAVIDEDATEYWKREDGHDPSDEEEYLTEGDLPTVYAAAPELLAALKDCVEWLESVPLGDSPQRSVTNAMAIIAKAEGRMSDGTYI